MKKRLLKLMFGFTLTLASCNKNENDKEALKAESDIYDKKDIEWFLI